ncbi:MAG: hypothetical protein QMD09_13530 [Desulfatibacillaceae bacterium]|nr:hypothetical protein [Desulfatibacillaceae bacterium]
MDKKKAAAAISGVFAYIRQEEEALASNQVAPRQSPQNNWGFSGRQDAMSMRTLMQLRALRSSGGLLR